MADAYDPGAGIGGGADPNNPLRRQNAIQHLKQLQQSWQQFPGRAPGGTGLTGLTSTDSKGWSQILQDQQDALNLQNEMSGRGPARVNVHPGAGLAPGLESDPRWWMKGMTNPTIESIRQSALQGLRRYNF